jgi:hypothetical protein
MLWTNSDGKMYAEASVHPGRPPMLMPTQLLLSPTHIPGNPEEYQLHAVAKVPEK